MRGSAPLFGIFLKKTKCNRDPTGRLEWAVKCIQKLQDLWLDLDDVLLLVGAFQRFACVLQS